MLVEPQGWGEITEGLGAPLRRLLEQRAGTATLVRLASGEELTVHDIFWGRDFGDTWEHITTNCSPPRDDRPIHFFHLSEVACLIDPETGGVLIEQTPAPGAM